MKRTRLWMMMVVVLAILVSGAWAQQKDPRLNPPMQPLPPLSAGESSSKSSAGEPAAKAAEGMKPDDRPLSGVEAFTLGTMGQGRSYFAPTLRLNQTTNRSPHWDTTGTFAGQLALQRLWSRYALALGYSGGGTLFATGSQPRSYADYTHMSLNITGRRWNVLLADSFAYIPESSYGPGGIIGVGTGFGNWIGGAVSGASTGNVLPAGSIIGAGLLPGITPSQTILNGIGRRISNAMVGQMHYAFSPRSSFTAGGSYGMLRFLDAGFVESDNYQFHTGYNYKLSAVDSLAVSYRFDMLRFHGVDRSSNNHGVSLSYGRKLTGRMALRLSGGPRVARFHNPLAGSGTRLSWSTNSALSVRFRSEDLNLSYSYGATSGSGVFYGSESHRFEGRLSRQLSRMWSGGLQFGYAHNQSVRQLNGGIVDRVVNTWHAGFGLHRPLGRDTSLYFGYNVVGQVGNNPAGCAGITCGRMPIGHLFSLGFSWSFGPYEIE